MRLLPMDAWLLPPDGSGRNLWNVDHTRLALLQLFDEDVHVARVPPRANKRRPAPLGRLLIPAGVAAALGCQSGPIEFSDTEGRVFVAECSDRGCTHRRKASGEGARATAVTLEQQGRLLAVCDSSDAPEPVHCRAVTCTSACPPRSDGTRPTCEDGLCIQPERTLTPADVRLLCLAGTGIGRNARQAERLALAAACTPPCEVPEACR